MSTHPSPAQGSSPAKRPGFTAVNGGAPAQSPTGDTLKRKRISSPASHKTTPRQTKKTKGWTPPLDVDSWEDLADVEEVSRDKEHGLMVHLVWRTGQLSKHHHDVVNQKMPQAVIRYYEENLLLDGEDDEPPLFIEDEDEEDVVSQHDSLPEVMGSDVDDDYVKTSVEKPVKASKTPKAAKAAKAAKTTSKVASKTPKQPAAEQDSPAKGKARTKPKTKETYWEIEDIVDDRVRNGKRQFRVRWVGYSDKHDTWVPEKHSMEDCPEAVEEYLEKKANEQAMQGTEPDVEDEN